jgi:hypothetical protein
MQTHTKADRLYAATLAEASAMQAKRANVAQDAGKLEAARMFRAQSAHLARLAAVAYADVRR